MDYYEALNVSANASEAVIRAAYRQRLKEVHPDTSNASNAEFEAVVEAGSVLLNSARRKGYDEARRRASAFDRPPPEPMPTRAPSTPRTPTSKKRRIREAVALVAISLAAIAALVFAPWSSNPAADEVQSATLVALPPESESASSDEDSDQDRDQDSDAAAASDTADTTEATAPPEADTTVKSETTDDQDAPSSPSDNESDPAETETTTESDSPDATAEAPEPEEDADPAESDNESDADRGDRDESDADLPDLDDLPERGAIYRAPKLYLVGPVPSQELADAFAAKASAVVGEENVVNEYVIHPDAPTDLTGNVRVEQAVTFETNSAVIRPEFLPVLGLALEVLIQNPQASLVIEGHTDDVGDPDRNQELSEERAAAVADWLEATGIDPSRLTSVGFGQLKPVADNSSPQGRAINRRIEVQIVDLLS